MLSQKENKDNALSIVRKRGVKIIKMTQPLVVPVTLKKEDNHMFPPADKFNTAYMKAKKHDPL